MAVKPGAVKGKGGRRGGTLARILNASFLARRRTVGLLAHSGRCSTPPMAGQHGRRKTPGTDSNLHGVHFLDAMTGWISGQEGFIAHTTDGGVTWTQQETDAYDNFYDIVFVNTSDGWAVGDYGTVAHTNDGGGTWTLGTAGSLDKFMGGRRRGRESLLGSWRVGPHLRLINRNEPPNLEDGEETEFFPTGQQEFGTKNSVSQSRLALAFDMSLLHFLTACLPLGPLSIQGWRNVKLSRLPQQIAPPRLTMKGRAPRPRRCNRRLYQSVNPIRHLGQDPLPKANTIRWHLAL